MFVGCWVLDERGEERPVGLWTVAPWVKHPWTRVRLWSVVCVPGAPHHPSQQHGSICGQPAHFLNVGNLHTRCSVSGSPLLTSLD